MVSILSCGLGLLAFSMFLHIVVWRAFPVKNQPSRLAVIFVVLPALILAFCYLAGLSSWRSIPHWSWASWLLIYLLDLPLSLAYMVLYTLVTGFSPSISILEHVEENMPQGLPRDQLLPHWFTHDRLAGARHDNLVKRGLVSDNGGVLQLQPRGKFVAICFLIFRRFIGLPDLAKG